MDCLGELGGRDEEEVKRGPELFFDQDVGIERFYHGRMCGCVDGRFGLIREILRVLELVVSGAILSAYETIEREIYVYLQAVRNEMLVYILLVEKCEVKKFSAVLKPGPDVEIHIGGFEAILSTTSEL